MTASVQAVPLKLKEDRDPEKRFNWRDSRDFLIIQAIAALCLAWLIWAAIFDGRLWLAVWGAGLWFGRSFFITGYYHRCLSHGSYKLHPAVEAVFAFIGTTAAQKGPVWWAAHHKDHHKDSDGPGDPHSPQDGFLWSHMGWISSPIHSRTRTENFRPQRLTPQLVWLDKHDALGPWTLGSICFLAVAVLHAHAGVVAFLLGGLAGLAMFFASTLVLWHSTFVVNSLTHLPKLGRKPYVLPNDNSRNSTIAAVLTGGEGHHRNHHRFQWSARIANHWWQWDPAWYVIWTLGKLGIAKSIRVVKIADIRAAEQDADPILAA